MTTINDYRFESVRLDSFQGWPHLWMKPEKLAAAGLYYTGKSDRVVCFTCNIGLHQWKPEDNPMVEHQRIAKSMLRVCNFLNNISCGNVPIGTDHNTIPVPKPRTEDVCGFYDPMSWARVQHEETEERVNYWLKLLRYQPASGSRRKEYSSYNTRLASYDNWPKARSQAEKLATAGFYYSGNNDETFCYYCGGGLKNWEPNSDPWVEHAKWFHYCLYLVLTKGTEFISNTTGTIYIKKNPPSVVDTMEEKFEKVRICDSENIASGRSPNLTNIKEIEKEPNTEASDVSGEASSKEQLPKQSAQTQTNNDNFLCRFI